MRAKVNRSIDSAVTREARALGVNMSHAADTICGTVPAGQDFDVTFSRSGGGAPICPAFECVPMGRWPR